MGWSKAGKGCPTINAAERALVEGYRMGLSSGKSDKGKGHGKGNSSAKSKGGGKGSGQGSKPPDRTCQREGCRAAEKKQPTWGGAANCHCCGLSLGASLPIEQLCAWAYQQRLDEKRAAPVDPKDKDKAKGADKDAAPPQKAPAAKAKATDKAGTPTVEELAARRVQRLAELRAAEAPDETPTQEVARVFVDSDRPPRRLEINRAEVTEAKEMSSMVEAFVEALKAESMPSDHPLKSPTEIAEGMLAKSAHSKTDAGKTQTDAALQTTRECLATLKAGGTDEKDELFVLMVAREKQQALDAQKLADKQPSKKARKLHLASMTSDFAKGLGAQADGRATGAAKAAERAAARVQATDRLICLSSKLKKLAVEANDKLSEAHRQRALLKETQGEEILKLLEQKRLDIEAEDEPDVQFSDALEESTTTEDERDEAQRLATLLQQQLLALQTATARADATIAEQAAELERVRGAATPAAGSADLNAAQAAEAAEDLWREFEVDPAKLPTLNKANASQPELDILGALASLFAAIPWGAPLPTVQFDALGVAPSFIHTLVGDGVWQACWGAKHAQITGAHFVPYKIVNVIKNVVEQQQLQPAAEVLQAGKDRYAEAVKTAELRRKRGSPY